MPIAKRPRVLIADDYPGMSSGLERLLAADCDVVGTVADGRAVFEAAQRLQPDVVVLDLNMPHVNGIDACRQITEANPLVRVLILTASNDPALTEVARAAGAFAFISKYELGDLLSAIIGSADRE
jgi:DNA-binding NarL/FixJ family response regulator